MKKCGKCGSNHAQRPVATTRTNTMDIQDADMVMIRYTSTNRGQHPVYGPPPKRRPYGYRKAGDIFLVHKDDVKSMNVEIISEPSQVVGLSQPAPVAPPPPVLMTVPEPTQQELRVETRFQFEEEPVTPPMSVQDEAIELDLQALPGVTPAIAHNLSQAGLKTRKALLDAGVEGLMDIKLIGENRARAIISWLAR